MSKYNIIKIKYITYIKMKLDLRGGNDFSGKKIRWRNWEAGQIKRNK